MSDIVEIYKKVFPEHLFEVKNNKLYIDKIYVPLKINHINEDLQKYVDTEQQAIMVMKEYFKLRDEMRKVEV